MLEYHGWKENSVSHNEFPKYIIKLKVKYIMHMYGNRITNKSTIIPTNDYIKTLRDYSNDKDIILLYDIEIHTVNQTPIKMINTIEKGKILKKIIPEERIYEKLE